MNNYQDNLPEQDNERMDPVPTRHSSWDRSNLSQQNRFYDKLSSRVDFNFEFVLMNSLVAIFLIASMLTGEFAFFIISILIAPTMTPIIGLAFGFSLPSGRLIVKSIISFLISSLIILLAGFFSGFIASQLSTSPRTTWLSFLGFSWGNLALIFVGVLFSFAVLLRNPSQSISVANVALAYAYYFPLITIGYLITMGESVSIRLPIMTFLLQFSFALMVAILVLLIYGVQWKKGHLLLPLIGILASIAIVTSGYLYFHPSSGIESPVFIEPIATTVPSPTQPPGLSAGDIPLPTIIGSQTEVFEVPTLPTFTEQPLVTATLTLTPLPTPVWAQIQAPDANGANVRSEAGYKGKIITSILNGTLVEVLSDVEVADGSTWVRIRLENNVEGWIVRSLLVSSTPAADW